MTNLPAGDQPTTSALPVPVHPGDNPRESAEPASPVGDPTARRAAEGASQSDQPATPDPAVWIPSPFFVMDPAAGESVGWVWFDGRAERAR